MASIRCGHCQGKHQNVRQVKECAFRIARAAAHQKRAQAVANTRANALTFNPAADPWKIKTPRLMVEAMREGRYAVEILIPGQPKDWVFIRVSRPKHGKKQGWLIIQTQHSDYYKPFIDIRQTGTVSFWQNNEKLDMALMMVAADPFTAAMNYGKELGCCSRCGRELTDERSRYYSIGPECEKYWPEIINYVNETRGVFVP